MKVYDNYDISPCRRFEEPDKPGQFCFEVCPPEEADVWTLYGHIDGDGAQAIGDFDTREHAEEAFSRITGIPFTGPREVGAHIRLMHSASRLLLASEKAWRRSANHERLTLEECNELRLAITEAAGRAA